MTREGRQIIKALYFPLMAMSFILYALYFQYFKEVSEIIRNMAPAVIFIFGGILAYANGAGEARRLRSRAELESTLTLSNYDIYFIQILMIFVPALTIFLPGLGNSREIDIIDFIQGVFAFFPLYWIRMRYFKYHYQKDEKNNFVLNDTVTITYYDSMILDAIAFIGAGILVGIPGFITRTLALGDIAQAGVFFLAVYWINVKYFKFT